MNEASEGTPVVLLAMPPGRGECFDPMHAMTTDTARFGGSWSEGVPMVVAIDGPVGSGKSSVAKKLAQALGWHHLDTGAMYRMVTLETLASPGGVADRDYAAQVAKRLNFDWGPEGHLLLDGKLLPSAIRDERVSQHVFAIADNRDVRAALVPVQRALGLRHPTVAEGRDMATVVFPDAPFKFYLHADARIRATRRAEQLERQGKAEPVEDILRNLEERDHRDRAREWGALTHAPDAVEVDTTAMSLDEVVASLAATIRAVQASHG
jgi:cytidylate kinase